MNWSLQIARRAKEALEGLPAKDRRLARFALGAMQSDPFGGDLKRLRSERSAWRCRVGS
jgi:hypothetical protein